MSSTAPTDEEWAQRWIGRELRSLSPAADPVNTPMIRHWVEAMRLPGAIHLDPEQAQATGRRGPVAPQTMAQAWTMLGFGSRERRDATTSTRGYDELFAAMTDLGYPAVVATDSEYEFVRELDLGERISVREVVESISGEKQTALGTGRFVTSVKTYLDEQGAVVARQRWRILRYRPHPHAEPRPQRPEIAINLDNQFWFDHAREHRLAIQCCSDCNDLRHPPAPACPNCQSFAWHTVEASGAGTVHSFVVTHHPRHPAFDYPLVVALVDLAEGTRLVANLINVDPDAVQIGMPVVVEWITHSPDFTLPAFRPAPPLTTKDS